MCPGQESNLHASRHTHLKRARLPIPPPGLLSSLHERKTRLELATPTLARLCSTNWAISANKGAKTSSGMSPNEISFSVSQCFAVQLSCLRLQRYTFFFIQQTFPYSFLRNNPKFLAQQGNLSQLGSLIITGHTALLLISFLPRIGRIERIQVLWEP